VRKSIELGGQIRVNDLDMSSLDQCVDVLHRVQCAAVAPIGMLFRLQISLENGIDDQNCRHHYCSVADGWYF